jgi:hypothetical protein
MIPTRQTAWPAKALYIAIKTIDVANGKVADGEAAAAAAATAVAHMVHNAAQQVLVAAATAAQNHWDQLAHAAQVNAGPRPAPHMVALFVEPAPPAGLREMRIEALRAQPLADFLVTTLNSGATLADLYMKPADALACTKLATGHANVLLAAQPRLLAAIVATPAVQLHSVLMTVLADVVLDFWRATVQGYTAADIEKARISGIEMSLHAPICLATVHNGVQAHWDAFSALNAPNSVGFAERLVTTMVSVCELRLCLHLTQNVLDDTLVEQAKLGATVFVRFVVSQARLATAKGVAAVVEAHPAVAALEVVIAGLRADQARLELCLEERGAERQQQRHGQQQQQRQQRVRGQMVGSPDYTGCNFRLPNGALCGDSSHARVDHPG